jgi:Flp pilus assembly protein TadD
LFSIDCGLFDDRAPRGVSLRAGEKERRSGEPSLLDHKEYKAHDLATGRLGGTVSSARWVDRPIVLAICLAGVTLAVYTRAIALGFVQLDDPVYVSGNQHVLTGLTLQNVRWSFVGFHDANWIPLTWLSLMLDADLFGKQPAGFHFTNVALHIASTLLLFVLLQKTTRSPGKSAFAAAMFALHPLHVESVAWIAERKDALSIFLGILSLLAYVNYASGGRWRFWTAAFLLFLCSLLTKQTLVTLPFVLLLLDYWPLQRLGAGNSVGDSSVQTSRPRISRLILEKLPFFAASCAFSVVAIFAQRQAIGTLTLFPFSARCQNAVVAYAAYLWQTFAPFDLCAFYPYPDSTPAWAVAGASLALLCVSAAAVIWIRKLPFLFVGWAWYLGTLVPLIGIVQIGGQQRADRYTYFPLIGIFIGVAWLVPSLVPGQVARARLLPAAALASLGLVAAATFVQIGYWGDSVVLYRRALEFAPKDPFLISSLGFALVSNGNIDEGLPLLEQACRTPPPSSKRHFALALALQKLGRLNEAAAEYQATLALDDTDAEAHSNLAVILSDQRQLDEARRHLLRSIEVDPDYINSYINLGVVCMGLGRYGDAISYSQRALELDPSLRVCHTTIALALRAQGRFDEAISRFRYLLEAAPDDAQIRSELERTLQTKLRASAS